MASKPVFFKGTSFLFDKFAIFLKNHHHIIRVNDQLHLYKDGIYISGQAELEAAIALKEALPTPAAGYEVKTFLWEEGDKTPITKTSTFPGSNVNLAKVTVDGEEIEIADEQISYFSHLKVQIEVGDDQDILEIQESLFPSKNKKNNGKIKAISPHYITINGIKIAFGKTDNQNDNLTFKRANPHYHFFHISDYSGSHVVIMDDNPSDDLILTASEIALILSKKSSGDIKHTKIKDVHKGDKPGQVHLKSYKNIYLTKVRKSTIELINNSSRF